MYLVTIHVPVYLDGPRTLLTTEWRRSLLLLRDSLADRLGPIEVVCPSLPAADAPAWQELEPVDPVHDGIRIHPSFDRRCRARAYWLRDRARWRADLRRLIARARVVHAGMCDVYRPINFAGHLEALRQRRTTVFVSDTDIVRQVAELARTAPPLRRLEAALYASLFDRAMRYGVRTADLALLKGRSLMARYGHLARCARCFQDTSHLTRDIVPDAVVATRTAELLRGQRPLRLVYCGRFVPRKGVDDAIRIVAMARRRGARVTLDLIGSGPDERDLRALASAQAPDGAIRLLGRRSYGPQLLAELAASDALWFTPRAEDTPRMIFDGYAAGLPLLAAGITYVRERIEEDRAGLAFPPGQLERGADLLVRLDRRREELATLARRALDAARHHAADVWYRRRAEWTLEAVAARERRHAA